MNEIVEAVLIVVAIAAAGLAAQLYDEAGRAGLKRDREEAARWRREWMTSERTPGGSGTYGPSEHAGARPAPADTRARPGTHDSDPTG